MPEVPEHPDGTSRYHLANVPFGYGDGLLGALLLGDIRPKRYVEVGSGWSSMLVLDLADRRFGEAFAPVFVDPFPDNRIRSEPRAQLLEVPVQAVPLSRFEELEAGDVLFVDSTHVAKPGSDVNWLLFEVLPRLARGVVVHFHDIHHPFEYPKDWVYQGRAWNEAYLLARVPDVQRLVRDPALGFVPHGARGRLVRDPPPACAQEPGWEPLAPALLRSAPRTAFLGSGLTSPAGLQ